MTPSSPSARATARRLATTGLTLLACLASVSLVVLAAPAPAAAELVVLDDGDHIKVAAFRLDPAAERMHLTLPEGGRMVLPLARIERIVDDEWSPPPEPSLPPAEELARSWHFSEDAPVPEVPWGELLWEAGRRHGVDPALVAAMVRAESAFDPDALSVKGARGLMQLMPATARRFGVEEGWLWDPAWNVEAGVRYLAWLMERFDGDLPRVLAAYNAGEGAVDRYDGVPPYRETRGYLQRIYRFLGLAPEELAGVL